MAVFKRQSTLKGIFKALTVVDGKFVDSETGEEIDVVGILAKIYGDNAFDLATQYKSDEYVE